MQDFQIYLAGGMGKFGKDRFFESNNWRKYCKTTLESYETDRYKVHVINPNDYFNFADENPRYTSQREIMELDLNKVRNADLVVINFNDMYSLGSMAELAIAYERRIPVIGVDTREQNLHPWQIEMCQRIFSNLDLMLDYVEDYYLTWEGDELEIIDYITTSHQLARELLNRPDDFITAISDDGEYVIGGLKRVSTHANIDDSVTHLALKLKRCEGNMIRWH